MKQDPRLEKLLRVASRVRPGEESMPRGFATEVVARWQQTRSLGAALWQSPIGERWAVHGLGAALAALLLVAVWSMPSLSSVPSNLEDAWLAVDAVESLLEAS